jgi:hypothetical protein
LKEKPLIDREKSHGTTGRQKGALVIRTKFGEVSAEQGVNFSKTPNDMIGDEAWRKAVAAEGGVFCYTDLERNKPF